MGNSSSGIRKIAQKAGVSIATVSRVLNDSSKVSPDTRERVLSVLENSDYRFNAAAKALATKRSRTIAAIIPTLEHSIFAVFLNAIEDQLAKEGYGLVIATHGFDKETEVRRCNEVLRLGAEGIILSGADHNTDWLNTLKTSGVAILFTSVYQPDNPFPSFGYDNRALAAKAIGYLADLGHRTISVLHGPCENNDRMRLRVEGIRQAENLHKDIDITLQQVPLHVTGGSGAARDWVNANQLPDACLCLADVLALGVIFESQKQQINIPQELSVMGFEDLDWAASCSPALTTVALPAAEMGRAAARAMVGHLDDKVDLTHRLFGAEIVERESTGRR
ncbi:MAG: LacI family DNA-binding transcriptional regulator [Pseudomonadota bacterium]